MFLHNFKFCMLVLHSKFIEHIYLDLITPGSLLTFLCLVYKQESSRMTLSTEFCDSMNLREVGKENSLSQFYEH